MIGLFNDCFPPIMDGVAVATQNYAYWLHRKGEEVCVVTPKAEAGTAPAPYPVYRYVSVPIPRRKPYRMGFPYLLMQGMFLLWRLSIRNIAPILNG